MQYEGYSEGFISERRAYHAEQLARERKQKYDALPLMQVALQHGLGFWCS